MGLNLFQRLFGSRNTKTIERCKEIVEKINLLEPKMVAMSDSDLKGQTLVLRNKLASGQTQKDILPEAFATVREVSKRLLNMRHYDVQLIGGMILHKGCIAEMKTGEGKTLVATLSAYLNALTGKVCIVTVNDYLAERDYKWMSRIYNFLGLSSGCVIGSTSKEERQVAYASDIVYVTNSEMGFDYLRDNMQVSMADIVIPDGCFDYAIVDEIDSILIDEARTPLIISGPSQKSSLLYSKIDKLVSGLPSDAYVINEKHKSIQLTESGSEIVEKRLKELGLIEESSTMYEAHSYELVNHVLQSLKAHFILKRDHDYILMNEEVMLIDEFTGRVAEGRRYSGGLHQAIEAKEGVVIRSENQTLASVTYQNFFRLFKKLSGMTGTGKTEAEEFYGIYKLEVFTVPTFKPITRKDGHDVIFATQEEKFDSIVTTVLERHKTGQPILIGTASIHRSEMLSGILTSHGVLHNVLNAKNHKREAAIIAEAGRKNAITIATNMAGRGTDILLGGSVDAKILVAIEGIDDSNKIKEIVDTINQEHETERADVVALGGLLIIGSERHESRRIDDQLRGRSGRLGDPGESQFFLSLEDDLLRIFGGDKMKVVLSKLGLKKGEAIEHSMLNRIIRNSQKKLENLNYEIRKNVLKYDDIINSQRQLVYDNRRLFVSSDDLSDSVKDVISNVNRHYIDLVLEQGSSSKSDLLQHLEDCYGTLVSGIDFDGFENDFITKEGSSELLEFLNQSVYNLYIQRFDGLAIGLRNGLEKFVLLQTMDELWKDHLSIINHIREGVHLRAYGQKDPFVEYKKESFASLEEMFENFDFLVMQRLTHIDPSLHIPEVERLEDNLLISNGSHSISGAIDVARVGRNEKCFCGSGRKYKHCHGKT